MKGVRLVSLAVFLALPPPVESGELGGRVIDVDGHPQYGIRVVACPEDGSACTSASTDREG